MNWRQQILAAWPDKPQNSHRCQAALRELDEALQTLASMGFPLHVLEGPAPVELLEWPKEVWHLRLGSRTVLCQEDLDELGPDWFPTLDDAKHAAGMRKQFERGGIFHENLPAPTELVPPESADNVIAMSAGQRIRAERRALPPTPYPVPAVLMPGTHRG